MYGEGFTAVLQWGLLWWYSTVGELVDGRVGYTGWLAGPVPYAGWRASQRRAVFRREI